MYKKSREKNKALKDDKKITKLASNVSFYLDKKRNKIITFLSKNDKKEVNRKLSRKIYNAVPDKETKLYTKRKKYQRTSQRRRFHYNKKTQNKFQLWCGKTAFVFGNIKISRFGLASILFIMLALASGSFALASNFDNIIPIDIKDENKKTIIYLTYGENTFEIETECKTVEEVILENDIFIDENDFVVPSLDSNIYNKMHIKINQNFPVQIIKDKESITINISKGTVKNALAKAGIEYDDNDLIVPHLNTQLSANLNIKYDKVDIVNIKEEIVIEYEVEYGETSTVLSGMYAITQKGKEGILEVTTAVTYINDIEESREIILEEVIKEPVSKIILNGTATKRAGETSSGGDDYDSIQVTNPNQQETNPSIPAGPGSYVEKVVAHVTAYTHTGSTTATGTWPRSTRTLENPGSSAVVPGTFPYGTLFYIPGYGYAIAEDTGGFRHDPDRWNQLDLFMNTEEECRSWGRRRQWTIYVLRRGYP